MNFRRGGLSRLLLFAFAFVFSHEASPSLFAQTSINSWMNPGSAPWEGAGNWSMGMRPASNQNVVINNEGYKAVGISGSTVSEHPESMTVNSLTVSAFSNSLSTVFMNYAGTAVPL